MDQEQDPRWLLEERGFTLAREHKIESLFAVGNGATGTRGSLEEGTELSSPAAFLAGVFFRPETDGAILEPENIPELVTFPNWCALKVWVDGSLLRIGAGELLEHRRTLDMQHGILHRKWRQQDRDGRVTRFRSMRLASLADRRLLLQQVFLKTENYGLNLTLESLMELGPCIELRLPPEWRQETRAGFPNLLPFIAVSRDGGTVASFCVASQLLVEKRDSG